MIEPIAKEKLVKQVEEEQMFQLCFAINHLNRFLSEHYKGEPLAVQNTHLPENALVRNSLIQKFRQAGWTITPSTGTMPPLTYLFS